jgi:acyl-CoA synthetase (AMP-forming)/AMP-acid ligase II
MKNSAEFVEIFFGIARLGAVAVPLNWRLTAEELGYIVRDAEPSVFLFDEEFAETVRLTIERSQFDLPRLVSVGAGRESIGNAIDYVTARNRTQAEDLPALAGGDELLYLMYTSGTTGRPKGVMHTHNTAAWALITLAATLDVRSQDRTLIALPLFHVGALSSISSNVYRGATSVITNGFDPRASWQIIEDERISVTSAVPAMLDAMIRVRDANWRNSTLRWCAVGGAPVPPSLIAAYADIGISLVQVYGLTESGGPACALSAADALERLGSTGKAYFHTEVRVVNRSGEDVAPGEVGEILVSGPHVMRGYWKLPDESAAALKGGWLRTGDAAVIDEDGFIFIKDRIKDMIISGGENVYPAEVEHMLISHPSVADVAVVGRSSSRWGEEPVAFVVRSDAHLTEAALITSCSGRLARFKIPKAVYFLAELPRNASGKVLKHLLRERLSDSS